MQMHHGQSDFVIDTDETRGHLHPLTVCCLILLSEEAHTTHHSTVPGETARADTAT